MPPSPGRDAAVMAAIHALRRTFAAFHRRLAGAAGPGVSQADASVLHFIAHGGSVTAGQIATFTGLTTGAVTSVVDRLHQAGFVERQRGQEDRRVVLVRLQPGAHAKIHDMMKGLHAGIGDLFASWEVDRIQQLVELLDELALEPSVAR